MNTNDLGRRHNKVSNGILASKCQLTAVFVGERRQIAIACTDFRKIRTPCCLGREIQCCKKLIQTDAVAFTYVLCLDWKIPNNVNVTEIPSRSDQNYEKPHISSFNI